MTTAKRQTMTHVVIPDTQTEPGAPMAHLGWIGQFIVDEYRGGPLRIIHLGDHWTMDSLSSYDRKGGTLMEGRRVVKDYDVGNDAWDLLNQPFRAARWAPERHFLMGNHEERIVRACQQDAQLDGLVTLDRLQVVQDGQWQVHSFLKPVRFDGVTYAHYFTNPMTGRPLAGANLESRLKTVGHSFTMGHQQGRKFAQVDTIHGSHLGLAVGSCYIHDPRYLGPQTTSYWRGIVVCHQVEGGEYDPMFVSLDYLCRRYEGKRLSAFKWRH